MIKTTILNTIVEHKKEWIKQCKQTRPLKTVRSAIKDAAPTRGFTERIRQVIEQGGPAVIAELKKASPSCGVIREDFDPAMIAATYEKHNAACLSVLTDVPFFQGADQHISTARAACDLPILRKDFIIDPYQVYETRYIGADCILLIANILNDARLQELTTLATELGLDVLVEVHNREELERGLMLRTPLIGINNRDLHTFKTDLQTTLELLIDVLYDRIVVTESGIHSSDDIKLMRKNRVDAFLIGEALLQQKDPGQALAQLFFTNTE